MGEDAFGLLTLLLIALGVAAVLYWVYRPGAAETISAIGWTILGHR